MFTLTRPTEAEIIGHLIAQKQCSFSYADPGMTRDGSCPAGFQCDRHRVLLGHGRDVFEAARDAVREWKMFPTEMATLYWPDRPIEVGTIVDVQFRAGMFWSINPARIVYTMDETLEDRVRFGFAYGTLPDHLERGEERFQVEWHRHDDSVWYDLLAASRPNHALAYVGYPIVRIQQRRFRQLSGKSMQAAVAAVSARSAVAIC